jgi:hypothetical protein
VPILFGIFARGVPKTVVLVSAVTALIVHFGMYYGEITMYANNPAVPATAALLTSTAIALVGYTIWGQPALPDPTEEAAEAEADA